LDELIMEKKEVSLKALVYFLHDGAELPEDFGAQQINSADTDESVGYLGGGGCSEGFARSLESDVEECSR
jgi:hypothetical protein